MVWQFSKLFLKDVRARRFLVPLVGLSSGIGWLFGAAKAPAGPVDMWQPEAITFLSIYLNPLFCAGLILMIASLYFLVLAERTGGLRYAIYAGSLLLALGNVHTYDVITVGCVWAAYVLVRTGLDRRVPVRLILLSLIAAGMALPSVGYQFYVYKIDPVYSARVNSPTPSPALWAYLSGYGLILLEDAAHALADTDERAELGHLGDVDLLGSRRIELER
jgi:hypothetical protein